MSKPTGENMDDLGGGQAAGSRERHKASGVDRKARPTLTARAECSLHQGKRLEQNRTTRDHYLTVCDEHIDLARRALEGVMAS